MAEAVTSGGLTLTWSGQAVDAGRIEAELVRLRYDAAGVPSGGQGLAIRTSLLNLVVYATDEAAARQASQTLLALSGHHPSRALIVVAQPSAERSGIDAQLAAHCHIGAGLEQHVCCEEVTLTVKGPAARHLHSVIIPLLVPDLPVYVWWTGPLPKDRHLFEEMLESADRFIVDSARFLHPTHGLSRLARLTAQGEGGAIGDLNWGRLAAWRQLLVQHWQTPDVRSFLTQVNRVEIGFAAGPNDRLSGQFFLFLGWLAARMGWDTRAFSRQKGAEFTLHQDGREIAVRPFRELQAGLARGWLISTRLQCSDPPASISIARTDAPLLLAIRVEHPQRTVEERVRIEPCDESEMLARELDDPPRQDAGYDQALEQALPLLEALEAD